MGQRVVLRGVQCALVCVLLAGPAMVAKATVADDLCTGDPCVIGSNHVVDPNSVLDFGAREVVLQKRVEVGSGKMTLLAGSLTMLGDGRLTAQGSSSSPGGTIVIETSGDIAINSSASAGVFNLNGSDAGFLSLTSTQGSITGSGKFSLLHNGIEASGGEVTIIAEQSVTLSSIFDMPGGNQGTGGFVDVTANNGDVSLTGNINLDAGEGGGGGLTIFAPAGAVSVRRVSADGGGDGGSGGALDITSFGPIEILELFSGKGSSAGVELCGDADTADLFSDTSVTIAGDILMMGTAGDCCGGVVTIGADTVHIPGTIRLDGTGSFGCGGSLDVSADSLISFSGKIEIDGGEGGAGDMLFSSDGDIESSGDIDGQGRSGFADGAILIEMLSEGSLRVIDGLINGKGGSDAFGAEINLEACNLFVGPTADFRAQGFVGSITMSGRDDVSLKGKFDIGSTGSFIEVFYGPAADPPDVAMATFIPSASITLSPGLSPCRTCTSDQDCNDNNPCTDDSCGAQDCQFVANDANLCEDQDTCTIDSCQAGVCLGTQIPGCGELEHFMSYAIKETKGSDKFLRFGPVSLNDQFGQRNYDILKARSLLLPANKNQEGVGDSQTHLLEYQVKPASGQAPIPSRENVQIVNQCNSLLLEVKRPISLLVPTNKDLTAPVAEPDPTLHGVDHFLCYQAKPQKKLANGAKLPKFPKGIQVDVADQFQTRRYELKKITKLCNPTEKAQDPFQTPVIQAGPNRGSPKPIDPATIRNPIDHLVCYQAKQAKKLVPQLGCGCDTSLDPKCKGLQPISQAKHIKQIGVHINNQFGPLQLGSSKEVELCIPSTKTLN